jgi:hypothetical protein
MLAIVVTVDDNSGASIPIISSLGGTWGAVGTNWTKIYNQIDLGSFTVGARTFKKYLYVLNFINMSIMQSAGVTLIQLANIYGLDNTTGVECISVYADIPKTGIIPVEQSTRANSPDNLDTGGQPSGYYPLGYKVKNSIPAAAGYSEWICITAGIPGTWKGVGLIQA